MSDTPTEPTPAPKPKSAYKSPFASGNAQTMKPADATGDNVARKSSYKTPFVTNNPGNSTSKAVAIAPQPDHVSGKKPKWLYGIPVALMVMGYVVGGFFVKAESKPAPKEAHVEEHHSDPTIDESINDHRWKEAASKIRQTLKTASGTEKTALLFRLGLATEMLDEDKDAAKAYADVVALEPNTIRGIAAKISLARLSMKQNRFREAYQSLNRILLLSGDAGGYPSRVLTELHAMLAVVEYRLGQPTSTPHPLEPYVPASTDKRPDLEQLMRWAGTLPAAHSSHGHGASSHGASGHDNHAKPAAKGHDDHGKPAAKEHDDHGKPTAKPAAKPAAKEHDDHGKPAAKGHDDHSVAFIDDHAPPTKKTLADDVATSSPSIWHWLTHLPATGAEHPAKDHSKSPATASIWNWLTHLKPQATDDHHDDQHAETHPKKASLRLGAAKPTVKRPVTVQFPASHIKQVLDAIAHELHVTLKVDPATAQAVESLPAIIMLDGMPLEQLLDALLHPNDMLWSLSDQELLIQPMSASNGLWADRTRKAIDRLLSIPEDHPWKIGLMIDLGNIEFLNKKWRAASKIYSQALEEGGLKPEAGCANYNNGLAYYHQHFRDRAKEQFQNLADRDDGGQWSALAYWWAGRCYLDVNEPKVASKYFWQAIDRDHLSPAVIASALALACCHIMQENYAEAFRIIKPYQPHLKSPNFKSTAAFVDALCRYRTAANPKGTGEAEDLLYAVLNAGDDSAAGPAGVYILGRVAHELSFGPRMAKMYERTLESLRGGLAMQMTRVLADYEFNEGDPTKARVLYQALTQYKQNEVGRHAWLQLAKLANQANDPDTAITCCEQAIKIDADLKATLKELGRAYEAKKDYRRAADAFAGRIPK